MGTMVAAIEPWTDARQTHESNAMGEDVSGATTFLTVRRNRSTCEDPTGTVPWNVHDRRSERACHVEEWTNRPTRW